MAFSYRLAAIDIDDTLVGPDKEIGAANLAAVGRLRELGCEVVLASGRRHENTLRYARELGLTGYVVSSQGAVAQHLVSGERVHEAWLTVAEAGRLVREGEALGLSVLRWQADRVWAARRDGGVETYEHETGDVVALGDLAQFAGVGAEKISWFGDRAKLQALHDRGGWGTLQLVMTNDGLLEFSAAEAHKGAAVAAVARMLGITREEVVTFGDGNNDVTMLKWAGMGVAMPHGRSAAREAANVVAPAGDPESALARGVGLVVA